MRPETGTKTVFRVLGFALAAFAASASSGSLDTEIDIQLSVPRLVQQKATSCGEAAITMAYNYAYPESTLEEDEVIDYAVAAGLYTANAAPFTSPVNMVHLARNYAPDADTGNVNSQEEGLRLLASQLESGNPVIIDVTTYLGDPYSGAHFVLVTGLKTRTDNQNAVVTFNNPLTGHSESAEWEGSEGVWNAWQSNGDPGGSGWWLVIPLREVFYLPQVAGITAKVL